MYEKEIREGNKKEKGNKEGKGNDGGNEKKREIKVEMRRKGK